MRTLIIGDIHGCLRELQLLLEKVSYSASEDRLIFVGDLINKGPSSLAVLEYVKNLRCEVILGNHELALLINYENEKRVPYPKEYIEWIKSWPLYIEEDDFIVVHGGIIPGQSLAQSDPNQLVRIRLWQGQPWYEFYQDKKLVVFGHWAANGLVWRENAIGLDTGCVYGRQLSCLSLPGRQLYQVDALEAYAPTIIKA